MVPVTCQQPSCGQYRPDGWNPVGGKPDGTSAWNPATRPPTGWARIVSTPGTVRHQGTLLYHGRRCPGSVPSTPETASSTQTAELPYQRSPSLAPVGCLACRGTVTGQLPGPGEPAAWLTGCRAGPACALPGDPRLGPVTAAGPARVPAGPPVQPGTATDIPAASAATTISLCGI